MIFSRVFERKIGVAAMLVAILSLVAIPGLLWLRVDNRIEQWAGGDAGSSRFGEFNRDFGGEDFLLLAYESGALLEEDALDLQLMVLEKVETLPEVSTVQSLPSLFRDQFGAESGEELRAEIESSPFYTNAIISADRNMAGMLIGSRKAFSSRERRAYVAAVREAAQPFRDAGWPVYVVGPSAVNAALDTTSDSESRRLLPYAVVASSLVLWVLLRSWKKVMVVVATSSLTLLITLGLMGWLGLSMNMVTVALPPVLWVLSSAYTVHLIRYHDEALDQGVAQNAATASALRQCVRPCFLAALTTGAGFLALLTATMTPVRELGVAAAMGIPIAFLVMLGMASHLLSWAAGKRGRQKRLCPLMARRSMAALPVLFLAAGALLASAWFARSVAVESNPLSLLESTAPIVRDSEVVADRFTGLYTLETILQLPGSWLEPEAWPAIEAQTAALSEAPGVARVLSPLDYLKKFNQWTEGATPEAYRLPLDRAAAEALLAEVPEPERVALDTLISPDGTRVRLSALVRVMDGEGLLDIVRTSEKSAHSLDAITVFHTGTVLRLVEAQFALVDTQLRSLGLAILIIFACIAIGLRSLRLLLLSIAPNLAPVAAVFGIMGLAGIPLDPATVMVAAMVLGIAVDDSMHLLVTWRDRAAESSDSTAALREALRINTPAMTATTATACAGFLVLGLSSFAPIQYFGLLSAAAMAVALAADVWLLPALIVTTTTRKALA